MSMHCVKIVQIQSYFWSVFPCIRAKYGDIRSKSAYSIQIQENTDQNLDTFHAVMFIATRVIILDFVTSIHSELFIESFRRFILTLS